MMWRVLAFLATLAVLLGWELCDAFPAHAQSQCNNIYYADPSKPLVLTPGQWNECFVTKQDVLGYVPLNTGGGVMSGQLQLPASTATFASLNMPMGVAPTLPQPGDMWATQNGLYMRVNNTTIGPFLAGSFAANNPLIGDPAGSGALAQGTVSGNTHIFQLRGPTAPTATHCVMFDANLNLADAGGVCTTGGGGGTVTGGTANQLAMYLATGNTVSGLATANNAVLVTSAAGVPSLSATLPASLTIPSAALSNPNLSGTVTIGSGSGYLYTSSGAVGVTASISTSTLTGTLLAAQFPAISGDVAISAGALTSTVQAIRTVSVGSFTGGSTLGLTFNGPIHANGVDSQGFALYGAGNSPGGTVQNLVYNATSTNGSIAFQTAMTAVANVYWQAGVSNGSGSPYASVQTGGGVSGGMYVDSSNGGASAALILKAGASTYIYTNSPVAIYDASTSSISSLIINATSDSSGANLSLQGNGSTTPNKYIRAIGGVLQYANSAYTQVIASLDDSGNSVSYGFMDALNYIYVDAYKQAGDSSDCQSFQRAYNAISSTGGVIHLGAKTYYLGNLSNQCQVLINGKGVLWEGAGWDEGNGNNANWGGTILEMFNPTNSQFAISTTAGAGTGFRDIAFAQDGLQQAPTVSGWTPVGAQPVIDCENSGGTLYLEHIMFYAVNYGVKDVNCARVRAHQIFGQTFAWAFYFDQDYDTVTLNDIQIWPVWSYNNNVMGWENQNADVIVMGRLDTPFIDDVFGINKRSVIRFTGTSSGVTTRAHIGKVMCDGSKYCIYFDSASRYSTAQIDQIDAQHANNTLTQTSGPGCNGTTSIAGSAGIWTDTGSGNIVLQVSQMRDQYSNAQTIGLNDTNGNDFISIKSLWTDCWSNGNSAFDGLIGANVQSLRSVVTVDWTLIEQAYSSARLVDNANGSQFVINRAPDNVQLASGGGASAAVMAQSNQYGGMIETGTSGVSNPTVTFNSSFPHQPFCTVTSPNGGSPGIIGSDQTKLVINTTATSTYYSWTCRE